MSKNKLFLMMLLLAGALISMSGCAGYNTQVGAATGAGAGALIGYGIGGDTESALIGAALGGVTGAVIGDAVDTYNSNNGLNKSYYTPGANTLNKSYYMPGTPRTSNYLRSVSGRR